MIPPFRFNPPPPPPGLVCASFSWVLTLFCWSVSTRLVVWPWLGPTWLGFLHLFATTSLYTVRVGFGSLLAVQVLPDGRANFIPSLEYPALSQCHFLTSSSRWSLMPERCLRIRALCPPKPSRVKTTRPPWSRVVEEERRASLRAVGTRPPLTKRRVSPLAVGATGVASSSHREPLTILSPGGNTHHGQLPSTC